MDVHVSGIWEISQNILRVQHLLKTISRIPPRPHGTRGVGVLDGVVGVCLSKASEQQYNAFQTYRKHAHPCFTKSHIYRCFTEPGFPKGRAMATHLRLSLQIKK